MRIVGGKFGGLRLAEFKGEEIRPTADRVKESLFNILGGKIVRARVLDLFCGSGNLGIESLSRGAAEAHFNDFSRDSLAVLEKNLKKIKADIKYSVSRLDFRDCLNTASQTFDIIFIDPPYASGFYAEALEIIARRGLLTENGTAVLERDRAFTDDTEGLRLYDERKYGKTYLGFFKVTK